MEIRRPGSAEGKMGYFPWLVSCRLIRLNLGCGGAEKKCFVQRLGRGICPGSFLDCGCGIKLTVKFTICQCQVACYYCWGTPTKEIPVQYLDGVKYFLLYGLLHL